MIKIENLVHKYTIWKDENTKSEKTVLDGIIIRYSVWSVCGNFRTEWFRKVYISQTFKRIAASE